MYTELFEFEDVNFCFDYLLENECLPRRKGTSKKPRWGQKYITTANRRGVSVQNAEEGLAYLEKELVSIVKKIPMPVKDFDWMDKLSSEEKNNVNHFLQVVKTDPSKQRTHERQFGEEMMKPYGFEKNDRNVLSDGNVIPAPPRWKGTKRIDFTGSTKSEKPIHVFHKRMAGKGGGQDSETFEAAKSIEAAIQCAKKHNDMFFLYAYEGSTFDDNPACIDSWNFPIIEAGMQDRIFVAHVSESESLIANVINEN